MATLEHRIVGDDQLISVSGLLDVRAVADLRGPLHLLIASGTGTVLLDLGECEVRDSTAFGLLVEVTRRSHRAGRRLQIVAANERTTRLLRRARLGSLMQFESVVGVGTLTA